MKFNVMFVDDSMSDLESLQWLFMDEPYYLFAFDNPIDALKVIKTLKWAVVVVNRWLPKMDVFKFLQKVHEDSPHTVGIMMTDHNEITGKYDMSCSESVFRFIKKPLEENEIKQAVKTATEHYKKNIDSKEQVALRL